MNLEQRINQIIDDYNLASEEDGDSHRYKDVEYWRFTVDLYSYPRYESNPTIRKILQEIEKANVNECLTSPHKFIREYKVWLNQNERP